MKICLLTRSFNLKGGGIGRVSSSIRDGLIRRGHEVHCISTDKEDLVNYFKYTALDIPFRMPRGMDIYHALTPMESIWIPKRKGISVIFDLIAITHPERYGGRLGRSVVTFHDLFPLANPELQGAGLGQSKLKSSLGRKYFGFACRQAVKCRYVVTVSEHVKKEVIRIFGIDENKVKVIKSGIRGDLEPQPKGDKVFRIGYLAQLDRRKRVDLLIKAFRKSSLDELVIGGKGLTEVTLKEQASSDNRIKFLGFIPDEKLVYFYNSLDAFVFPTAIEGYGLPPVEAMACKKPVIVLDDAIIPWEVKSRCIIVQDLDPTLGSKAYLEALCKSIDIEGNYTWAKEHNWDKCIDSYLKLYEEIIS